MLNKRITDMLLDCAGESDFGTTAEEVIDWVLETYTMTDEERIELRNDRVDYINYLNEIPE